MNLEMKRVRPFALVAVLGVLIALNVLEQSAPDQDVAISRAAPKPSALSNEPVAHSVPMTQPVNTDDRSITGQWQVDRWEETGVDIFEGPRARQMRVSQIGKRSAAVLGTGNGSKGAARSRIRPPNPAQMRSAAQQASFPDTSAFIDYESEHITLPLAEVDVLDNEYAAAQLAASARRQLSFPYPIIGFYAASDKQSTQIFLSVDSETQSFRVGELVGADWRLIAASPAELIFQHVPTQRNVTMALTEENIS